jgi:drug/metabolite transporter (DMT)-like permease
MMWLFAALSAACLWGVSYAAVEHALKGGISTFTLLVMYCVIGLPIFGAVALYDDTLKRGIVLMKESPAMLMWIIIAILSYGLGNVLVLWAVRQKNATAVSFIEISYPLFVAVFSFLLFQVNHLNLGTAIGGALVFAGVAVMYMMG